MGIDFFRHIDVSVLVVIKTLKGRGMREKVKIIVGGIPINREYAAREPVLQRDEDLRCAENG